MGRGGIRPRIAQRAKARFLFRYYREYVEQIPGAARQPIQPGDKQSVAFPKRIDYPFQLLAVGDGTAHRFSENLPCSRLSELVDLCCNALSVCRYSCIPENHSGTIPLLESSKHRTRHKRRRMGV